MSANGGSEEEALLIRIDAFRDKETYMSILKSWLQKTGISKGRLVSMGDLHLLFILGSPAQNDQLLQLYRSEPIDTNRNKELSTDKFIDVLGRKSVSGVDVKGFLEMTILNASLLDRLLVGEWKLDAAWLKQAQETSRTKAFLKYREEMKAKRKEQRQKAAQERDRKKKEAREQKEASEQKEALEEQDATGQTEEDEKPTTKSEAEVAAESDVPLQSTQAAVSDQKAVQVDKSTPADIEKKRKPNSQVPSNSGNSGKQKKRRRKQRKPQSSSKT